MKKIIFLLLSILLIFGLFTPITNTQANLSQEGKQDIQSGQKIYNEIINNKVNCNNLKDDDFEALGEYFMGQSIGNTEKHAVMNQMMKNMMGEKGEKQMHITLGKRYSGCDSNASTSQEGYRFLPMMGMMGSTFAPWSFGGTRGGGNSMMGFGWNNMMGWNGFGLFGWIWMLLFWVLLVLAVVALFRHLGGYPKSNNHNSPLDILKERYAKGEIDKKEYEEKKKELL